MGFWKELVSDETNRISSKRVAGLLCVVALVVALIANTFSHESIKPSDMLVESVALFAFGALGLTSIDKFTKNKQ
jgi:intracellular septation protein A